VEFDIRDIKDILFSEERIKQRVNELGEQITYDYTGKAPLLVGILKGCFIFMADLARCVKLNCEIRFLSASSYGNAAAASGSVEIERLPGFEIAGRDIIIVEDILDTGATLAALREFLAVLCPSSLKICAMLDKPSRRKVPITADYLGFECPDEFLVGYGLDYAEHYRNLPYVASLKPEVYS
jgi:hypoxanthine phosphoribosyltransferase